jgi:microcystin-dependent protein
MALDENNIEATRIALSGAGPIPNAVLYNNAKDLAAAMKAAGVTFGGTSDPLPIGSVVAYSGATIPTGYLDADGSSQLRASYPDLFAVIGTTYGPGALPGTTFALPNFVGTYTNFIIKATAAAASTTVVSETLIAVPLGSLQLYAGSVYPTGWLRADGTAIGRATYAGLFAIIGTTYGAGDGSTTFNLPNLSSSGVPSPVYIIKVTLSGSVEPSTVAHASSHIRAGTDVIDGDRVQIDYVPSAYTRNAAATGAGAVTDLTAHLAGIGNKFSTGIVATGGIELLVTDYTGATYRVHAFSTIGTSTLTVTTGGFVNVLIVAGGGGGGGGTNGGHNGGGGGAGGLIYRENVQISSNVTVVVGGGGPGSTGAAGTVGGTGGNSSFGLITALGGGGGGPTLAGNASSGGSGGGGSRDNVNNQGALGNQQTATYVGYGNRGGNTGTNTNPGGGGGAGGEGQNGNSGSIGGPGMIFDITGTPTVYARGGNGNSTYLPTIPGTGNGGDGGNGAGTNGRSGASGVVLVRYRIS